MSDFPMFSSSLSAYTSSPRSRPSSKSRPRSAILKPTNAAGELDLTESEVLTRLFSFLDASALSCAECVCNDWLRTARGDGGCLWRWLYMVEPNRSYPRSLRSNLFKILSNESKIQETEQEPSRPGSRSLKDRFKKVRRTSKALDEEDNRISENLDKIFKQMQLPDDKIGEETSDQGDYWQNQFVQRHKKAMHLSQQYDPEMSGNIFSFGMGSVPPSASLDAKHSNEDKADARKLPPRPESAKSEVPEIDEPETGKEKKHDSASQVEQKPKVKPNRSRMAPAGWAKRGPRPAYYSTPLKEAE